MKPQFPHALAASLLIHSSALLALACYWQSPRAQLARGEMCFESIESAASASSPDLPGPAEIGKMPVAPLLEVEPSKELIREPSRSLPIEEPSPMTSVAEPRPIAAEPAEKETAIVAEGATESLKAVVTVVEEMIPDERTIKEAAKAVQDQLDHLHRAVRELSLLKAPAPIPANVERGAEPVGSRPTVGSLASQPRVTGFRNGTRIDGVGKPNYPLEARIKGWEGEVTLEISVGADGTVTKARIVTSTGHDILDLAAKEFAERLQFEPARLGGEPVSAVVSLPIRFRLR